MEDVDLMTYMDNFLKIDHITSSLVYGDPNLCLNPLITIAIPTYRRPHLLKQAINSVLSQTNSIFSYEIIIVDNDYSDCCVSETYELIKRFSCPNILYYQNQENLGMVGNWNRCISLSRGSWVSFLHDDDVLMPEYFVRIGQLLSHRKDIGGIIANYLVVRQDKEIQFEIEDECRSTIKRRVVEHLSRGKLLRLRQVDSYILSGNTYGAPTCGSIFQKSLLVESGGFCDALYPSFDWFFLYSFCKKYKLYRSMEPLGYYRLSINESLSDHTKSAFIKDKIMFNKYAAQHSNTGKIMRLLFENEQNRAIMSCKSTEYSAIKDQDYFDATEIKERKIRSKIYELLRCIYPKIKARYSLIFG